MNRPAQQNARRRADHLADPCGHRDAVRRRGGVPGRRRQQLRPLPAGGGAPPARRGAARSERRADPLAAARSGGGLSQPDRSDRAARTREGADVHLRARRTCRRDLDAPRSSARASGRRNGPVRSPTDIERRIDALRKRYAGGPRPKTLVVFGREAFALRGIYASGGIGFIHDMITAAGGDNVFADTRREAVQATSELIIARAPEVILELRGDPMEPGAEGKELRGVERAVVSAGGSRQARPHHRRCANGHPGTAGGRCRRITGGRSSQAIVGRSDRLRCGQA